jgi:hypothetical protein
MTWHIDDSPGQQCVHRGTFFWPFKKYFSS